MATLWSATLLLAGLWFLRHAPSIGEAMGGLADPRRGAAIARGLSVCWMAAAEVTFMCFVADPLCPHAAARVTGTLKAAASLVMAGALAWTLVGSWPIIRLVVLAAVGGP